MAPLTLRICKDCQFALAFPARNFSSTTQHLARNRNREAMFRWLNGPGSVFRDPLPGSTNYLAAYDRDGSLIRLKGAKAARRKEHESVGSEIEGTGGTSEPNGRREDGRGPGTSLAADEGIPRETEEDMIPFPLNPQFRSETVLSEELKEVLWHLVAQKGVSVRKVSATYHIDMRRVGAVVRLKEVERQWERDGKRLATPYNRALLAMLPQTPFRSPPQPHESIHDLPVHKATVQQMFHPMAESRHFTRFDAGQAFEKGLLPADQRIQHPELVSIERVRRSGRTAEGAVESEWKNAERDDASRRTAATERKQKSEEARVTVANGRWDFRFQDVKVDEASVGMYVAGTGRRYGVPAQDRKKGQVKIPTRVN